MQERTLLPGPVQSAVSQVMEVGSRVQPFSAESLEKASHVRGAKVVKSVCPYCAVGCGLNVYVKDGQVIDIEGNPDSPINHGTLCPKGAATFQYTVNPSRLTRVLYRAPYSDHWEVKSLDWAMEQIAQRVKKTRDETFVERLPDGREVNHTLGILGNIGRPGGGVMALRGHASIQGSTDVPTLYDLLAGYMSQPSAMLPAQVESEQAEKAGVPPNVKAEQTLAEYNQRRGAENGLVVALSGLYPQPAQGLVC